jgi:hypothetical protein
MPLNVPKTNAPDDTEAGVTADVLSSAEAAQNRLTADVLSSAEAAQNRLTADVLSSAEAAQNRLTANSGSDPESATERIAIRRAAPQGGLQPPADAQMPAQPTLPLD